MNRPDSMASALCIDPDQPAQSGQTDLDRHIPSQGDRVMIPETESIGGEMCLSGLACAACLG